MFKPAGIFLNSMSPENDQNRNHLVRNPQRPAPENKYCAPRGSEMFKDIRSLTSDLGRLCETTVLNIWDNPPVIDEEKRALLQRVTYEVGLALDSVRRKTMRYSEINTEYQRVAAPNDAGWIDEIMPQNESLATILKILDELGLPFLKEYRELTQTHNVRYLVEAALIIAKEYCRPSLKPQQILLPDVRLSQYTQLDAIFIPSCSERTDSFEEFLGSEHPQAYEIVEIKTILRASKTSGPDKLRTLPLGFIREQQGRLATVILWWLSKGHEHFPFPRAIQVICLRGLLPTVVHEIKIDTAFLDTWLHYLSLNFDKEGISGEQIEDLIKLIPVIETEYELQAEQLRERMERAHRWLEAHRNEKLEQKPLFIS